MSKRAHERKGALKVNLPNKATFDDLDFFLGKFNKKVDDAGVFEDVSRTSRFVKKSQRNKQKEFSRLKNIRKELEYKKELEDEFYEASVTK